MRTHKNWQTTPTSPRPSGLAWKRYLDETCPHGLLIALVDGTHVRNHYDSDFSQGGNGFRYDFVPRDEIWIDQQISEVEWPLIAFHECRESELMRHGWSYDRAHDRAKYLEDQIRQAASTAETRAQASLLEQQAMELADRGEERAAADAYGRAALLREQLHQWKRASDLRILASQAIKPRYGDFVDLPLALR